MRAREYDAIIVGASFAGLAVARELRGEVLLLDRHEVGSHQTSACGTPLWVPQALGVGESVLQVHRRVVVHAPSRTVTFDLSDAPYCTFDYGKFSRGLLEQSRARFLRTSVIGLAAGAVETTEGRFRAPCLVDCSGWQGVLVDAANESVPPGPAKSFGLGAATAGRIFVVGDAAGHCLPFTAEGIRPALYFGQECGRLLQRVIEGAMSLDRALQEYRRRVEAYRWAYRLLALAQWAVIHMPDRWLGPLAEFAAHPRIMPRWWPRYSRFGSLRAPGLLAGTLAKGRSTA